MISQTILELRSAYANEYGYSPLDINNGNCENFACNIDDVGFGRAIWGDEIPDNWWSADIPPDIIEEMSHAHCFIEYRGKYFDSECPQGCEYPDKLPFFIRELKNILDFQCLMEHRHEKPFLE